MATSELAALPTGMRRVYRRFERWRSSRSSGRVAIPEALWAAAAELAREHGVTRTAQVLHLDGGKLKRRMQSGGRGREQRLRAPEFVEWVGPTMAGAAEHLIELEGPRGRMRIQWKGTTTPDLAALARTLWEPA
jgi:hypothetical protein